MKTIVATLLFAFMFPFVLKSQTVDFTYDMNGNRTGRSLTVTRALAKDYTFLDDESDAKGEDPVVGESGNDLLPEEMSGKVRIYPNPFSSTIVIDMEGHASTFTVGVEVFSIVGRLLYRDDNYTRGGTIDLSNLQEGIYVLRITMGPERLVYRIVKTY